MHELARVGCDQQLLPRYLLPRPCVVLDILLRLWLGGGGIRHATRCTRAKAFATSSVLCGGGTLLQFVECLVEQLAHDFELLPPLLGNLGQRLGPQ